MRVLILMAPDARRRDRYISAPLIRAGHDVQLLPLRPFWRLLFRVSALRRERPDVIISTSVNLKALIVFLAALGANVPFVLRLGGDVFRDNVNLINRASRQRRWTLWLSAQVRQVSARCLVRRVRDVVLVNSALIDAMRHRLRSEARATTIPQYSTGDVFQRDQEIGSTPVILTAANLGFKAKAQGVIWLIDRMVEFAMVHTGDLTFRIAGGGAYLEDVQAHLARSRLPSNLSIECLGFVQSLEPIWRSSNLFVYHSTHDGTPNVLLEARRWSLPCLLNRYPPFESIVEEGESGLIFDDKVDFKRKISDLLQDEALRRRIAAGGVRAHHENYSIDIIGSRWEQVLEQAIKCQH